MNGEIIGRTELTEAGKPEMLVPVNGENTILADAEHPRKQESAEALDVLSPMAANETRDKVGAIPVILRLIAGFLAIIGILSYGYLGYRGVVYLGEGGFASLAAKAVFGGVLTAAYPQTLPEEEPPEADDGEDAPEVQYLQISSENIGCEKPFTVFNETEYVIDEEAVQASAVPAYEEGDTVLLIHTHGTEGYAPEGDVSADEDFRTNDPENSVVAVGKAFAEILQSKGINTIHCTEMFDEESYIDAYSRSSSAVAEYMAKYPEISYVIDIHRDAVIRENGTVVRSDSGGGAQLMIVCGTDEMGANFPDWRENFAFGAEYQNMLYERDPRIVRHMNLRSASFNQQLCDNYLLLEVGTCGNTLAEAVTAARTAAEVFADLLCGE